MSSSIEKRRQAMLDIVNQSETITFAQLEQYFPNVSGATLRKDLRYLSEQQLIVRFHGGVKSVPRELSYVSRSKLNVEKKKIIAAKAVQLIRPNQSIFITAGSTCAELARQLPDLPYYLFTDGLDTAINLHNNPNATVELLGGELNLNIMRIGGTQVYQRIEELHFNICFLGTPSFHPEYGFSYVEQMTATCLKKVAEHSEQVVMLMDSSKVNYTFTPCNIPFKDVNMVISDGLMDEEIVSGLQKHGITVL